MRMPPACSSWAGFPFLPFTACFSGFRHILTWSNSGSNGYAKAEWYWLTRSDDTPDGLDMLGEMDDEKRRLQRRLVGPFYSTASMHKYEDNANRVITEFVDALSKGHFQGSNIALGLHCYVCDALGEVSLSERPGYVKDLSDHGVLERGHILWSFYSTVGLSQVGSYIMKRLQYIAPLVCIAFAVKAPPRSHMSGWLFALKEQRLAEAESVKSGRDSRNDMAHDLILLHHNRPEWKLHWAGGMMLTNLGAGHDTSLSTMLTFFANVGTHPSVKSRLIAELEAANLSDPPRYNEVIALPYFEACLKEAMRLYPVVWMSLVRKVPSRGATIDGYFLPGGTTIGANPFVAHRNTDLFGADADTFRPERWLEGDESRIKMSRALLIWGGQSRTCPGQHLALFLVCKVLATLLIKFRVEVEWDKAAFTHAWFASTLEGVSVKFHAK